MTSETRKLERVIFARNREIAERDAEIKRLKVHISNLTRLLRETLKWLPKQRRERILPLLKMEAK